MALGTGQLADLYRRLSPAGRRFHPRGGLPFFVTIVRVTLCRSTLGKAETASIFNPARSPVSSPVSIEKIGVAYGVRCHVAAKSRSWLRSTSDTAQNAIPSCAQCTTL